jgi:tetratricopeptide (TPR) repeat protein
MYIRTLIWLAGSVALAGCATAINQKNADIYYEAALRAEASKNWSGAKEMYSRSLANARSGGASPAYISAVTYNLGRMTGYTCEYADAEKLLLESVSLEQGLPTPNMGNLTKRWSELAQITYDQGKYAESAKWFAVAIPELEKLNIVSKDPIGYAAYLDDYAQSVEKSGQVQQASVIRQRAASLRSSNPGISASFKPVHYHEVCGQRR